jgi:glutamine amidotransferase
MAINVAIIDYGMGNLHSVYKKLLEFDVDPILASTENEIVKADKILLPGVGHFEAAINHLKELGIYDALNEAVLIKKKQILGICLGMQLMAKKSEEGNVAGFGWIDANVIKFKIKDKIRHKVPQTGWNTINICKESSLFKNIDNHSEFYFLHSYHYETSEPKDVLTETQYEYDFVSAVEKDNIFGTQFHPEKSHDAGAELLKNFIKI